MRLNLRRYNISIRIIVFCLLFSLACGTAALVGVTAGVSVASDGTQASGPGGRGMQPRLHG